MDGLRWLLLLFGLLVVAGVYLYSRRERTEPQEPLESADSEPRAVRFEPSLGGNTKEDAADDSDEVFVDRFEADAEVPQQKIVTLRIVAKPNATFAGDELALSLRGIGMRHGKFGIFHRYDGADESSPIFSAASLVEPGSFDLNNLKEQQIPGISLFMVMPGPIDGAQAFDMMIEAAKILAKSLGAELLDESGSTLSIQRERYLREEIIQFQHGILVA
jgi:cell division protein ZipA